MKATDGFYLEEHNHEKLKEVCKKRGDKSKIMNAALTEYFQKKLNSEEKKAAEPRIRWLNA